MNISTDQALAYCDASQEELLALINAIVQIPAPSNREQARSRFILQWLHGQGIARAYIDGADNVIVPFHEEARADISAWAAHIDTVFPADVPLTPQARDGRLYAPGVGDDTANVAVLLLCIRYLAQQQAAAGAPLLFAFNTGEEGLGNLRGVKQIFADYRGRIRRFVSLDGTMANVCTHAVGSVRWRVRVETEGGHSYGAFGNRNAIACLASMIQTLYGVKVPAGGKTTYNVGGIEGGTSVNTIAQHAQMLYEYRSDSAENLAVMERMFLAVVEAYRTMGIAVIIEELGRRPSMGRVDETAMRALVEPMRDIIADETGLRPDTCQSSTDCNIPLSLGIPAAAFGAYSGGGAHTVGEWIEVESLKAGMRVAMRGILSSCS